MIDFRFVIGTKNEIPTKYLIQYLKLKQMDHEEIFLHPPPSIEFYKKSWVHGLYDAEKVIHLLAIDKEDNVMGFGFCSWNIKYDNLDKGYFWIYVKKEERNKGIEKRILKELMKQFPEAITIIMAEAFSHTDRVKFIESLAIPVKYQEVISVSVLSEFDKKEVKEKAKYHREKVRDKGYDIIYIEDMSHPFHLDFQKHIEMVEEIWNDMPREELSYEDDVLTIDRFRNIYERELLKGEKIMTFVAIHRDTGFSVGLTCSYINRYQPEVVKQEDTGVLKQHRGNGLGLALKYQMLDKLLNETDAKIWRTGNAGSNEHMLRINRELKYEPYLKIFVYEIAKEELLKKLEH